MMYLHMAGTGFSTGCPITGGTPDNRSAVMAIDWLQGRRTAHDKNGNVVAAGWHTGKAGMIGKSYDGTLANAAASTGVEGLTTIVPISAISSWYDYTRSNGVIQRGGSYPSSLANTVTNPDRRAYCAATRAMMAATDGDEHGDYTPFWAERDYVPNADNVDASVFVVHGTNDENVRPDHFSKWWKELKHTRRKLWLTQTGHIDPFDFRRGGVGRHDPPLVRPGAVGHQERHPQRARGHDRALGRRLRRLLGLARRGRREGQAPHPGHGAHHGRPAEDRPEAAPRRAEGHADLRRTARRRARPRCRRT